METQQTIGEWIDQTFPGTDPESPRKSIRALEELVELCLASGATPAEVQESVLTLIHKNYVETGQEHEERRPNPDKIAKEAADVVIVLNGVAHMRKFDLQKAIDDKMAVNRVRKWNVRGDGTGYHVPDGTH